MILILAALERTMKVVALLILHDILSFATSKGDTSRPSSRKFATDNALLLTVARVPFLADRARRHQQSIGVTSSGARLPSSAFEA